MAPSFFCAIIEFSQQSHRVAVSIPILQKGNLKTEGGRHLHIRWGFDKYVQKRGYRCYAFGVSSEVFGGETQRREDTSLGSLPRETELGPESRSLGSQASVLPLPPVSSWVTDCSCLVPTFTHPSLPSVTGQAWLSNPTFFTSCLASLGEEGWRGSG